MDTHAPDRWVFLAFFASIILAGNNAIAVKYSNAELPPFFGAAIRFILASLILLGLMLILRLPLQRGRALQGAMIYGILSTGVNYALMYWALQYISPGTSMVLLALTPLFTFILAWVYRQEPFRWKAIAGAVLALAGIGIIARNQISLNASLAPILAIVLSALCFAAATVLIKRYPGTHPISTNAISLLTGSILLFIISAITKEKPILPTIPSTWLALLYLIIFGSVVVFVLTLFVVKHWTASASSYMFVLMPIVTVLMSTWLTHESVTLPFVAGGALVLSGTYIGGIADTDQWKCTVLSFLARLKAPVPECE
jgi:drug/metabolite transporter (DMT)-like permease